MRKLFKSKLSVFFAAILGSAVLAFGASASAFTYTWFSKTNTIQNDNIGGNTAGAYYRSGTGTEEDPFIIDSPVHLRNLAWLQYIGKYNQIEDGSYNQTYFKVAADLDMDGFVLPPIGTTLYPFIGNFDAQGHTISNLTTANSYSEMTKVPSFVKSVADVNVIGFFGVIGDPGDAVQDSAYSSSINEVKNFNLQGVTVRDSLSTTLIGIAAGYVNAPINGVTMSDCTLKVPDGGAAPYNTSLTSNLSNYTSIGYCTDNYKAATNDTKVEMSTSDPIYTVTTAEGEGETAGWGGSIDMKSLYNRLSTIYDRGTNTTFSNTTQSIKHYDYKADEVGSKTTTGSTQDYLIYNGGKAGKATFSYYNSGKTGKTYLYLYGKKDFTNTITEENHTQKAVTESAYVLGYNGTYLVLNGTTLSTTTDVNSATGWTLSSTTGNTTFKANGTSYYLITNRSGIYNYTYSVGVSTSTSNATWSKSGNTYYRSLSNKSVGGSKKNYYLVLSGSSVTVSTSNSGAIFYSTATVTRYEDSLVSSTTRYESNGSTNPTYFPLNADSSSFEAKKGNTGYITSGIDYSSSSFPYKSGDARVSQYSMTDIYKSLNGSSSSATYSDSKLEVITRTANSGSFVRISDDYNSGNTSVNSSLSSSFPTKTNYNTLGLTKYKNSRKSLGEVLSGDTNIYGLHFMDAAISNSKKFKTDYAMINGKEYDDGEYELPENCIDFNLAERGAVNFFGGSYFSGSNSFFCLNQIERSGETISSIKEITEIYGDSNSKHTYVYKYSDGTYSKAKEISKGQEIDLSYSGNYPASYSLVFDTTWIKAPTWQSEAVYYFEIPVNKGEYALGSASGRTGAYLLYLDIGGNAQEINRTAISSTKKTTLRSYEYPLGVSFVDPNDKTKEDYQGAAMTLTSSFAGSIQVDRNSDTISYQSPSYTGINPSFKGNDVTLMQGSTEVTDITPTASSDTTDKILTYVDYNTATDETTKTVYIEHSDGSKEVTIYKEDGSESEGTWDETEIDVSGVVKDLSYTIFYYGQTEVVCELETTYAEHYDDSGRLFYEMSGYKLNVSTTATDVTLTVTLMKSGYAVYVNGTLVGTVPYTTTISPSD